jgi:DNA polymerase alpha-associated DNA helicase A
MMVMLCFLFYKTTCLFVADDKQMKYFNTNLNDTQKHAIQFALNPHRPISFIHGPPGTGKTYTIIEILLQVVHNGQRVRVLFCFIELFTINSQVLVCAPSNVAIDNILQRCITLNNSRMKCVRLGHAARTHQSCALYTLDALMESSEEMQLAQDAKRELVCAVVWCYYEFLFCFFAERY